MWTEDGKDLLRPLKAINLLHGVWVMEKDIVIEPTADDAEIKHPFEPDKIRIDSKFASIDTLIKRMEHNEIDLSPDFQRGDDVWNDEARSRLIESMLVRIPIPIFFFDASNEDRWIVIDGLQRLTTLRKFVIDKSLTLKNLEYLTDLDGQTFDTLHRKFQRRIQETQVTIVLVEKGTPENVMFNIFKRINTGGQPLNPQEIRHALNRGPAVKLLKDEADTTLVTDKIGFQNTRMEGSELILRALAYMVIPFEDAVNYNYDDLLNQALKELNKKNEQELNIIRNKYRQSVQAAFGIFDEYAFRKQFELNGRKNPFNKQLYEAWIFNLSRLSNDQLQSLVDKKDYVISKFVAMMNDQQFNASVNSGKPTAIKTRLRRIQELIGEFFND